MTIQLEAKNDAEKLLLEYLQENATEALIDKINNGVYIEKDGKRLLNKKTLAQSLNYCCQEARKMAKGANSACVKDEVVFGWCVHYFEEDSLEGTLYNEDGTELKPTVTHKKTATVAVTKKPEPKKKNDGQQSIFDLLENAETQDLHDEKDEVVPEIVTPKKDENTPSIEEIADRLETAVNEKYAVKREQQEIVAKQNEPVKKAPEPVKHWISKYTYVDENGEIHEVERPVPECLRAIFQGKIVAR